MTIPPPAQSEEWTIPVSAPHPVGENPFHAKGSVFRTTGHILEGYIDGGLPAVLERVGDPALRAFWEQPLLAGGWYDVFGMVMLVREIARMRGVPYFKVVSEMSRMVATADLNGIYRALLRLATPELVAPRLPRIQARYMDFGDVTVGSVAKGRADATRTGHPRILAHWYVAVIERLHAVRARGRRRQDAPHQVERPRDRWHVPWPGDRLHPVRSHLDVTTGRRVQPSRRMGYPSASRTARAMRRLAAMTLLGQSMRSLPMASRWPGSEAVVADVHQDVPRGVHAEAVGGRREGGQHVARHRLVRLARCLRRSGGRARRPSRARRRG